jgi:hypothetical protein
MSENANEHQTTIISITIQYKESKITLSIEQDESLKLFREKIKSSFNFKKTTEFELYTGKYLVSNIFDEMSMSKLNKSLCTNTYVILSSEQQSYIENDLKKIKLEIILNEVKQIVDEYSYVYEVADSLEHSEKGMDLLLENLKKIYEDICKEYEYLRKTGIMHHHDQLHKEVEGLTAKRNKMKQYLENAFEKIVHNKLLEQRASNIIKENKQFITEIYEYNLTIDQKKKKIVDLERNRKFIYINYIIIYLLNFYFRSPTSKKERKSN